MCVVQAEPKRKNLCCVMFFMSVPRRTKDIKDTLKSGMKIGTNLISCNEITTTDDAVDRSSMNKNK